MQANDGTVLTLFEAAELLRVSEKTLWQQARDGRVPHFKIGKQYRFVREALVEWARKSQEQGSF